MNPEFEEFSSVSVELIDALLASSPAVSLAPISEEALARFAFGWASDDEEDEILESLIASGTLRDRLMVVRRSLDHPETRSDAVRRFLAHAVEVSATAFGSLEKGIEDWKSSFEQSVVIHAAMREFADRVRSHPRGPAFARSSSSVSIDAQDGDSVSRSVALRQGNLVDVRADRGDEERLLCLDLVDDILGIIPLAAKAPEAGAWRFQLKDVEGWDEDALAAARLRLRFADERVVEEFGEIAVQTEGGRLLRFPLLGPICIREGEVRLEIEFGSQFKADHGECLLEASFNAGPCSIPLRKWAVRELPDSGLLLAPIPCSLERYLSRAAISLRLRRL